MTNEMISFLQAFKIIKIQATDCKNYFIFLSAFGPHPGIWETLESPHKSKTLKPLIISFNGY